MYHTFSMYLGTFLPKSPSALPLSTSKETPCKTWLSSKDFVRFLTSSFIKMFSSHICKTFIVIVSYERTFWQSNFCWILRISGISRNILSVYSCWSLKPKRAWNKQTCFRLFCHYLYTHIVLVICNIIYYCGCFPM